MSTEHHTDEQPASIAAAIVALYDAMPAFTAPAAERAAWFETKAAVFDRIATSPNGGDAFRAKAAELAAAARDLAESTRELGEKR